MDKRQKILNAATRLFVERGFQNTSTANISKEAGVATGTLFIYFATKDELINTIYKEAKQRMAEYLKEGFPEGASTRDKLKHLWAKVAAWALDNSENFRFMHMFSASPFITNLTREEVESTSSFAMQSIKDGMKSGEIANIPIELFHSILDGFLSGTVRYIAANPSKRKKAIEDSFDVFWNGIKGK